MNTESHSGDDALAEGQTLKMSPDQMQALLAAAGQAVTRELRGWQPPSVEVLQGMLPQYEITEFIARGGMGAVYKGVQRALDRAVAIKILPPDIVEDGEANYAQRFKQEARAMAKFKHPGIVTVHDAGETPEGLLYFVMEFVEGTDVAHLVAAHGQLPPEQAIRITTAVCDALAYAHARGVVHRDIKPSNIMIDADGQVKVADFGLAKITTHESGGLTKSSVAMGTPDFVAPEALIVGTLVDQRADIYAVGVMLYQMLTGHIPRGRFSPVSAVVPKSDPKLDAIVDKAMQTDREKRYGSAAELKADVEKVAPGFPSGLRSSPHDARTGERDAERGRTRHGLKPMTTLAAAAAVIMLGAGGWWAFNRPSSKMDARPQAAAPVSASPAVGVSTPSPATATKDAPFINTLGMKFVPVPITGGPTDGQRVLFSIWETRVQDYEAFAKDTKREWPKPAFEQGPTHPAVNVSWEDATAFGAWLTDRERKAGRLGADEVYRLPSDHEWSCAVGIGSREDASASPEAKSAKMQAIYPWGSIWPPPKNAGNYGGKEAADPASSEEFIFDYLDAFPSTSPVGSFVVNTLGLHDLGGNAWEWCEDAWNSVGTMRTRRGASFSRGKDFQTALLSSMRATSPKESRTDRVGFRVVLASRPLLVGTPPATATKDAPFVNTLGMKFVPVPITGGPTDGQRVLFSIWETRVQDYEAFAKETKREWSAPTGTERTIPAVSMIRDDAKAFCVWLTERERAAGRLGSDMTYRLPTDHEWSCAVGIGDREDAAAAPTTKNNHLPGIYPWGGEWPPPKDAGNFADESYRRGPENKPDDSLPDYDDGFASIAPVGSFASNPVGLFDLAGNVIEIVEAFDGVNRFGRGSSWRAATKSSLQSDLRVINEATHASNLVGFRVVLAPGASAPKAASAQPSSDRAAAEWVLGLGGSVTLKAGGQTLKPKSVAELPTGPFAIVEVRLETLKNPVASLAPLAELAELASLTLVGAAIRDETLSTLRSPPNLKELIIDQSSITDVATGSLGKLRLLERLTLSKNKAFTGRRLGELALPRLFSLALQRSAIADEALKQIALLKNLRELDLSYTPVTDAAMGTLTPLHQLGMLQISNTKVTSAGLAALGPAVPLQRLEWTFPREGGKAQFEKVAAAFPQLSAFCLETTGYMPGDIPVLAALSRVRELQLLGDGVTDGMLQELLHLPQITSIYIRGGPQFTGRGLTHLSGHPSIASVKLEDLNQIIDADVLQLTAMKRLSSLKVLNCKQITPASFDAFRRARPEVKIEH